MIERIVAVGASITSGPWLTWLDFLSKESQKPVINLAVKGVGNEYMAHAVARKSDLLDKRSLVVVMLTNIDKWDWYVQNDRMRDLQQEKHQPIAISDHAAFWCTGSWFPGPKQIYLDQFYDQDYFAVKTIQSMLLLKHMCAQRGSALEIFFDSPIWNHTEQDLIALNRGNPLIDRDLLAGDLASVWKEFLEPTMTDIRESSLIGHCWTNRLRAGNSVYGNHPPSSSHWSWYQHVVRPRMAAHMELHDCGSYFCQEIDFFDQAWLKS